MNIKLLTDLYEKRGYDKKVTEKAIQAVLDLEKHLTKNGVSLDSADVDTIKQYIEQAIKKQPIDMDSFLAMARYFYLIKKDNVYIYFTKVLGNHGVIDNIKARIIKYAGQSALDTIFNNLEEPPLGTPMEEIPLFTKKLMEQIEKTVEPSIYEKFLAGNNHGIPEQAMQEEKLFYEESDSMEDYLIGRHKRKVAELQAHCDSNTVWFEQIITQDVVDFVAKNQEILSAKKEGNKLYVTKIPYDIVSFLQEKDPKMKQYYACHCPFARESILSDSVDISANWCYCSAGFAKFPFEVILDRELGVKLLKSPLKGDMICRFEIDLGDN